jgi:hypothetical protein
MTRSKNNLAGSFSLAPGFSPVSKTQDDGSRFNGFSRECKAVETACVIRWEITGLKPGANESFLMRNFAR